MAQQGFDMFHAALYGGPDEQTRWLKTQDPDAFDLKHLTGMFKAFEEKCDPESLQKITRTRRCTISYADQNWLSIVNVEDWVLTSGEWEACVVELSNGMFRYSPDDTFVANELSADLTFLNWKIEPVASAFLPIIHYGARYLGIEPTKMEQVLCSYSSARCNVTLTMSDPTSGKLLFVTFKE